MRSFQFSQALAAILGVAVRSLSAMSTSTPNPSIPPSGDPKPEPHSRVIPWMEKHPVLVGLIAAGVGGLAGGLGTTVFKFAEIRAASAAATEWSTEFATWKERQDREHESWLLRRNERLEKDVGEIRTRNYKAVDVVSRALLTAADAEATAATVKTATDKAKEELGTLLKWSRDIRDETGGLAEKVKTLLAADPNWTTPLAQELGNQAPPIGAVMAWPNEINDQHPCPPGWHPCNGDWLPISDKQDPLWLALRHRYAAGQARGNSVKLPDFRGYFLRGADATSPVGSRQSDQVGQHKHSNGSLHAAFNGSPNAVAWEKVQTPRWNSNISAALATAPSVPGPQQSGVQIQGLIGGTLVSPNRAWAAEHETRPINYAVHWIIRVK